MQTVWLLVGAIVLLVVVGEYLVRRTGGNWGPIGAEVVTEAEGNHEGATCDGVYGWAWDRARPNEPISVDILDGDTLLATAPANQFRPDLQAAGLGNGYHSFSYSPGNALYDGRAHSIYVRTNPGKVGLTHTPLTTPTCPKR